MENNDLYEVLNRDSCICELCQSKLVPRFINFEIDGVDGLSIYEYDDNIKAILYQLKGCYDVELAPVFLNRFKNELHLIYRKYLLVAAPSYIEEDDNRGFRHVEEIFRCLNLQIIYPITKTSHFKQAENTRKSRKGISHYLQLTSPDEIKDKNVLIIDDVSTTGSTIKAMINLVKKAGVKKIKILVMSKRIIK